jgi:hypothetical protein
MQPIRPAARREIVHNAMDSGLEARRPVLSQVHASIRKPARATTGQEKRPVHKTTDQAIQVILQALEPTQSAE